MQNKEDASDENGDTENILRQIVNTGDSEKVIKMETDSEPSHVAEPHGIPVFQDKAKERETSFIPSRQVFLRELYFGSLKNTQQYK